MKNVFAATLAIAVAQAIEMQVDQSEGCAANGDISLQRPPNQFVRIDSAWGPDKGEDWYDDDDCIPFQMTKRSEEAAGSASGTASKSLRPCQVLRATTCGLSTAAQVTLRTRATGSTSPEPNAA